MGNSALTHVKAPPNSGEYWFGKDGPIRAGEDQVTRTNLDQDLAGMSLDAERRRRIAETLGVAPRAALSAFLDYGLSDTEIAGYHRLPTEIISELRDHWGL